MNKKRIKLKQNWGNFGIDCVLFTAPEIMDQLVQEGTAEYTSDKLKYVAPTTFKKANKNKETPPQKA